MFMKNQARFIPVLILSFMTFFSHLASASSYQSFYRYNDARQVTAVIQPKQDNGKYLATRNTYNNQGLLTKVENGYLTGYLSSSSTAPSNWSNFTIQNSLLYTYDAWGRQLSSTEKDTNNNIISIKQKKYNAIGLLECEMTRMSASISNNACLASNHNGIYDRVTKYSYHANNSDIVKIKKAVGSPEEQDYATFSYLRKGVRKSATDANNNYSKYKYDGFGRLSHWYFPSKTKGANIENSADYEYYKYDKNSNLTYKRKRSGEVIRYEFDPLNRQKKKNISGSAKDVYYAYDNRGLLTYARFASTNGLGITRTYTGFGELKTDTTNMGGTTRTLNYLYDKHSNRTRITHPDGKYFHYEFDNLDRLSKIFENSNTNLLFTQTYNNIGLPSELKRGTTSSNITKYTFDGNYPRLSELNWQLNGSDKNKINLDYNRAGQIQTKTLSNLDFNYVGDENLTGSYTVNGLNQYTNVAGKTITHDTKANLTSDGYSTFAYDVENRLTTVSGANSGTLKYDPLGRLYELTSAGVSHYFLYDGDSLLAEYQGSSIVDRFVHGAGVDTPLLSYNNGSVSAGNRRYLHANHQGSIVGISNNSHVVTHINTYDSYGIAASNNQGRFGYTGQLYLKEIGLNYYKARV